MARIVMALIAGVLFGVGLTVSGMINPGKVLGFLDVAGDWDPSLAFVMAGAIPVAAIGTVLGRRRGRPFLAEHFLTPVLKRPDARLLGGAVLFGLGWGLVGFCPGPALASLGLGLWQSWVFVAAMLVGMAVFAALPLRKP
jgi:uncharacterized membrane protein YedE/YeeE